MEAVLTLAGVFQTVTAARWKVTHLRLKPAKGRRFALKSACSRRSMRFLFDLYFGTAVAYRQCRGSVYVRYDVRFSQPVLVPTSSSARARNRSPLRSTFSNYGRARLFRAAPRNRDGENYAGATGRNCRVGEGNGEQADRCCLRTATLVGRIQEANPNDVLDVDEPAREPGSLRQPSDNQRSKSRIARRLVCMRSFERFCRPS